MMWLERDELKIKKFTQKNAPHLHEGRFCFQSIQVEVL